MEYGHLPLHKTEKKKHDVQQDDTKKVIVISYKLQRQGLECKLTTVLYPIPQE